MRRAALLLALLPAAAAAQVAVPAVGDRLGDTLEQRLPPLDERIDAAARRPADATLEAAQDTLDAAPAETLPESAGVDPADALDAATRQAAGAASAAAAVVGGAAGTAAGTVNAAMRPFAADVDPFGHLIEKNVLVVLVDNTRLDALRRFGLTVVAARPLDAIGMSLLTLQGANSHSLASTAVDLRRAFPQAVVDYNHLYFANSNDAQDTSPDAAKLPSGGAGQSGDSVVRIGMIDSAVMRAHEALSGIRIEQQDFVTHAGTRPLGHGTAVASLLAGAAPRHAELLAASVFFRIPDHAAGATTESLVAALDWLASAGVDVINMSLAGPRNALLERALVRLAADGPMVVAAVGNNGPSGEPLYPAAYAQAVGVTAVDRDRQVFRYANRGSHVGFAALGVDVKVADAAGGYRIESGTSMAAPLVAAVIAEAHARDHAPRAALLQKLIAGAEDLGRPGFDEIFGHGLVAGPPAVAANFRTPPPD